MMKKTFKQLLGITLSAAMIISMAGCGNEATKNTETQVVSKETETTQTKESETQTQVVEEELTYPLNTDDKLTIWTSKVTLNSDYTDWTQSPFHTGLAEMTGVELEWQFPQTGQQESAAYNLLMTEDVLPDIIFRNFSGNVGELEQLYEDGVIYDLTEYLPVYAPDYWAVLNSEAHANAKQEITASNGKMLGIAAFVEGDYNITYTGPMVRKDWLDACGLDIPVTIEDWENMLVAFKEKYGAAYGLTSGNLIHGYGGLAAGFGAYGGGNPVWFISDDNTIELTVLQPEWVEYMKTLNRWMEEGLLDPDSVTMDSNALRTKAANDQLGATYNAMSQLTNYVGDAESNNTGAEWIAVPYPRTAAGEPTCTIQGAATTWTSKAIAVITTSCSEEKLITALQFLNYGYTEEGMRYWNFGEEGVAHTLDSNGEPVWTEAVTGDAQGLNGGAQKYSGASNIPMGVQLSRFVQLKNNEIAANAVYTWIENTEASDHIVPTLALTVDENTVYTDKFAAIRTYVKEAAAKFITGELSLEDDLDDFYAQLEKLGVAECQSIQQAAYDRYLAK